MHNIKYAGKSAAEKLAQLRADLVKFGAQAMAVTALDEVNNSV